MKNILSLSSLIIIVSLFLNACKKEEEIGMDFKINGAKDLTLFKNDSIIRDVTFLYLGGSHEELTISCTGVPSGVSINFSSYAGTPDFVVKQTIKTTNVDTGVYPINVTGTTPLGKVFKRTFYLTVAASPNISPTISLNGNYTIDITLNQPFLDPGATAHDPEDGTITSQIITYGNVNVDSAGNYPISYVVYDSGGLKDSVTRTVRVFNSLNYVSGSWTCKTITPSTNDTTNWITTIQASATVNNRFLVFKIGNDYLANPIIDFNATNGTLALASQTFYCQTAVDTSNHTFVGTGSITSQGQQKIITLDYIDSYFDAIQGNNVSIPRRDIYIK
ncbi:MAG: DUF5011 domain-containing protein [Bacteroidota bacterium]